MRAVYQCVLFLYPRVCRAEFAEEMLQVVSAGSMDVRGHGLLTRMKFHGRELAGLLAGAVDERLRVKPNGYFGLPITWRRFAMRSSFRFPKSVAPMMLLVFAVVLFTIARAASTAVKVTATHVPSAGEQLSLPLSVGLWLGLAYLLGVVVWFLIHVLHQSGSERLSGIVTWPQR